MRWVYEYKKCMRYNKSIWKVIYKIKTKITESQNKTWLQHLKFDICKQASVSLPDEQRSEV